MNCLKILLIEDDIVDQMVIKRKLTTTFEAAQIDIASTIADARQQLRSHQYDFTLVDLHLSDGIAFELASDLKTLPFILLTGSDDKDDREAALSMGAVEVLVKDINLQHLGHITTIINNTLKKIPLSSVLVSEKNQLVHSSKNEFNLTLLKKNFNNDDALIKEIIQSFLSESKNQMKQLNIAGQIDDKKTIFKTAHQLKSSFALMGMKYLSSLSKDIEQAIKSNHKIDFIQRIIKQLTTASKEPCLQLKHYLNSLHEQAN